jgi:hypothetical protein
VWIGRFLGGELANGAQLRITFANRIGRTVEPRREIFDQRE